MIKHIPNTITSLNLLSGCFAIIFANNYDFKAAFLCIIAAAVFDFFDGFSARLLKAYSPIGKELDSLADMVSFGVAPAIIMYKYTKALLETNICFIGTDTTAAYANNILMYFPLAIAVFSGLRLAKFNIDTRQTENFIGLATPSCALLCGALVYSSQLYACMSNFFLVYPFVIPMIAVVLSYLLVSEIKMFSFKFKTLKWKDNSPRFIFLAIVAVLGLITILSGLNWSLWVLSIFVAYIVINLAIAPFSSK